VEVSVAMDFELNLDLEGREQVLRSIRGREQVPPSLLP
jgi:hypothetical protein